MSIPRWRYVEYTDDGCALFQCLNCYEKWESRTSPGYTYEGVYKATWRFCPVCGIEWVGSQRERSDDVGPRRLRINEAIERRRDEDFRRCMSSGAFDHGRRPIFWWIIEAWNDIYERWEPRRKADGGRIRAARVLEVARNDVYWVDTGDRRRVILVKDIDKTYGHCSGIYEIHN